MGESRGSSGRDYVSDACLYIVRRWALSLFDVFSATFATLDRGRPVRGQGSIVSFRCAFVRMMASWQSEGRMNTIEPLEERCEHT